jgi:hypothetical protein
MCPFLRQAVCSCTSSLSVYLSVCLSVSLEEN